MKLDLDFSVFSRLFRGLVSDFGQKKLWPGAVVLLAAIVAVPVLLSKSSSPAPVPQAPLPTPAPATGASLPTLNVQSAPGKSRITGPAHNPFLQGGGSSGSTTSSSPSAGISALTGAVGSAVSTLTGGSSTTGTTSSASSAKTGTTSPGSSSGSSSSSTGSSGTSGSTSSGTPRSITGSSKPKPPTGLTSTESYDVSMAITNGSGGVNTVDPLGRLSLIPSNQQALLVELGVLKGGSRVLFAVQHGAVVQGPGICTPGPIDCEVISLAQDQTESVASRDSATSTLFAITGITAVRHSSAAAAMNARDAKSAAGQAALDSSNLSAVSLFKYEPKFGSVVDLRDLTVGG